MSKSVSLKDIEPFLEEILAAGGSISFMPNGQSMLPLIREGKDSVVISPVPEKLNKYDVILYKRENGQFVLHRIVKAKNGSFVLCGDNQTQYEYNVTRGMVIGYMTALKRDGNTIGTGNREYKAYLKKLYAKRIVKRALYLIRRIFGKLKRSIIKEK